MLYLCISEGPDGEHTNPVVATSDPDIIRAVLTALERRLGVAERSPSRLRTISVDPPERR